MGYMAPEQFRSAKSVGYTADVYALGVVVFRMLTGRLPFVSRSLEAVIRMKTEQHVPPLSSMPGVVKSPLLDWFVQKAMAREPEARFQSAREMLEQWWNVMASLDEHGSTDVMRGVGRVDESYAGRRPEARAPLPVPPSIPRFHEVTEVTALPWHATNAGASHLADGAGTAPPTTPSGHPADHEDRTIRRVARPGHATTAVQDSHDVHGQTSGGITFDERAPLTVPSHGVAVGAGEGDTVVADLQGSVVGARHVSDGDPFDLPTRSDPNLRKLVERELELQKARRRDGG